MAAGRFTIAFETEGNIEIVDVTSRVQKGLAAQDIKEGVVTIHVAGATGAVTTVEYEPGLVRDVQDFFERLVPEDFSYNHDADSPSGNAHSHLRATLVGPSISVPFIEKKLTLGTWQQIIFIDFDNRPRSRELICQVTG